MKIERHQVEAMLAGCEGVTPGPYSYRPLEFDDWGIVRGPDNGDGRRCIMFQALAPVASSEEKDKHRINKTDPYGDISRHLARCDPDTIAALCAAYLDAEDRVEAAVTAERERVISHLAEMSTNNVGMVHPITMAQIAAIRARSREVKT